MPKQKLYATNAARQAAYRQRQADRLRAADDHSLPAAPGPCNIPPTKRWKTLHDRARALLEQIADEMQEYFDNRSDNWQESERAETMQERVDAYQAVLDDLDTIE